MSFSTSTGTLTHDRTCQLWLGRHRVLLCVRHLEHMLTRYTSQIRHTKMFITQFVLPKQLAHSRPKIYRSTDLTQARCTSPLRLSWQHISQSEPSTSSSTASRIPFSKLSCSVSDAIQWHNVSTILYDNQQKLGKSKWIIRPRNTQNGGTILLIANPMADSESGSPDSYSNQRASLTTQLDTVQTKTCEAIQLRQSKAQTVNSFIFNNILSCIR